MPDWVHVYPRSLPNGGTEVTEYQLPGWAVLLVLVNLFILFPAYLYVVYTVGSVFPILAAIENENPPAYEPVALNDDDDQSTRKPNNTITDGKPITSSLRATHRLLRSTGGFRAYFRGILLVVVTALMAGFLDLIFRGAFGGFFTPIASLLTFLTTVQISTAWVHVVMSLPVAKSHWKRLPSFQSTFDATWKPIILMWLATELVSWLPKGLRLLLHFEMPNIKPGDDVNHIHWQEGDILKIWTIVLVTMVVGVLLIFPINVVLVRVQASLLPVEDEPIIPFDRSFQGLIEPLVVNGKGYATMGVAWSTISASAWRRIILQQVKIFAVMVGFTFAVGAIIAPQIMFIMTKTVKHGDSPQ